MSYMFFKAGAFNQPLSGLDTSSVQNMRGMFLDAHSFNQPLVWSTDRVTDVSRMFHGATSFRQQLLWDVARGCVGENIFSDPNRDGALVMRFPRD